MFNEQESIRPLGECLDRMIAQLGELFDLEFILVDDGSTDGTPEIVADVFGNRAGFKILRHQTNRGVAAAIITDAEATAAEVVCSIDSDCTYDPCQLADLIPMLRDDVVMVTASPYHPEGRVVNVPQWRLMLSRVASLLYGVVLERDLYTYTSCLRAYRRSVLLKLPLRHDGFVGIAEIVWQLDRRGYGFDECPAILNVRHYGQSKMRTAEVAVGHLGLLWRAVCDRICRKAGQMILSAS